MNELIDYQCVDWKKLLIIKAKSLDISDEECYILLLILTMDEIQLRPINPHNITKLSSLSVKKIDQILASLLNKHLISRRNGRLDLKPLYKKLLAEKIDEEPDTDLVSVFENVFGRTLNQMEIENINSFKTSGYDDKMILDALNEAVKSNVVNFRYIERILENWAQYGVKKRFAPAQKRQSQIEVDDQIKEYKWWENDE